MRIRAAINDRPAMEPNRPTRCGAAAGQPLRRAIRFAALLLGGLTVLGLLGACTDSSMERAEAFRSSHIECNPNHFRRPCQIGPDGKLYRYLPGETDERRP